MRIRTGHLAAAFIGLIFWLLIAHAVFGQEPQQGVPVGVFAELGRLHYENRQLMEYVSDLQRQLAVVQAENVELKKKLEPPK